MIIHNLSTREPLCGNNLEPPLHAIYALQFAVCMLGTFKEAGEELQLQRGGKGKAEPPTWPRRDKKQAKYLPVVHLTPCLDPGVSRTCELLLPTFPNVPSPLFSFAYIKIRQILFTTPSLCLSHAWQFGYPEIQLALGLAKQNGVGVVT